MTMVKFSDVVTRANTKEDRFNTDRLYYVGGDHIDSDDVLVHNRGLIAGSTIGPMFYFGFKAGQVLFVTRNPHLRKCAYVTFDGICSEKTFVLETKDEEVLCQRYLPWVMQTDDFWNFCEENKSGSVNYFVNWSTLADYDFELPPIDEQRRLADLLWAANDLKEAYKRTIAASNEMIKSRFMEMFGTPDNNPKGYAVKTLSEISSIITGSTPSTHNSDYWDGGYPWVSAQDMKGKYIHETVDTLTQSGYDTCKKVPPNSILFVCRGSIGTMAITAIECAVNQSICAATALKGITHEYLYAALMMQKEKIQRIGCGTSFKSINQSTFSKIKVIVPPIPLQNEFIAFAEQVDKSKFALTRALADLDKTIKGILNQALEG